MIVSGYNNWKTVLEKTKNINHRLPSIKALCHRILWKRSKLEGNITKNREVLKNIIRSVLYCARQEIGLGDHYNANTL